MNHPGISVIVPTFNDQAALADCIAALMKQEYDGPVEIIVVDNGSTQLPVVPEGVKLLVETMPGSYNGRNRGIQIATYDIFAFTDADCRPRPQWLSQGVAAVTGLGRAGLVGGRVVTVVANGQQPTIPELFEMAIAFPQDNYIAEGRYAATANMLTTRDTMERVGPFDGRLMSGGDKEWGRRVAGQGFALTYAHDAAVEHPARASHDEVRRKVRRIVGGERDRQPTWGQAMRFAVRHLLPPRTRIRAVMKLKDISIGRQLLVVCYSIFINWMYAFDRIVIQLFRRPSSR